MGVQPQIRILMPWLLVALVVLGGCATAPPEAGRGDAPVRETAAGRDAVGENGGIVHALYDQHEEWAGTPYRYGGSSRAGVDCSGFVQTTYASRLGRALPRTTRQQARVGTRVGREAVQPGDLVFFRPADKQRHVGIYVENGRFLHASTSRGVTLSDLDNPYWRNAYWMARRP
ncbi:NlpC/P60 family protein [Aquisalimonas lutea]|uniref:C40 family peptidase n=1 Tax=Aquisalimonas lutea TaxID=1327750 RepID=UPI0025B5A72F|nr:NlpC/P60 family protein [Aquisalimonas lutea]MDN3518123.1 NlpC/P60 family protein [Aquisalimonas lutea]